MSELPSATQEPAHWGLAWLWGMRSLVDVCMCTRMLFLSGPKSPPLPLESLAQEQRETPLEESIRNTGVGFLPGFPHAYFLNIVKIALDFQFLTLPPTLPPRLLLSRG